MGLLDRLRALGESIGIVQTEAGGPVDGGPATVKVVMRTVTLTELGAEVRAEDLGALSEQASPAELSVDFGKVYEAGGIKVAPASQWTVERLAATLETAAYKKLDRAAAQREVVAAMTQAGAAVEDVVRDAVARDKALDAYAEYCRKKREERANARSAKLADLQAQIKDMQDQAARLADEARAEDERWKKWWGRKLACEERMAWAIGYLLDRPVVTVDRETPGIGQ